MDAKPVLIEVEDRSQISLFSTSGLLLDNKYVLITPNLFSNVFPKEIFQAFQNSDTGKLYPYPLSLKTNYNLNLNVVWKESNGLYAVKKASPLAFFLCDNIKKSNKHIFKDWAMDSIDNNRGLNDMLSLFFVLNIEKSGKNIQDFRSVLTNWWDLVKNIKVTQGDEIVCVSTPFANRNFIDSYSKGIVSNMFGNGSCFILSDCPTTPGSEGSPVYTANNNHQKPVGIVLSCLSWWKGEWIGLTLIADIRPILTQLAYLSTRFIKNGVNFEDKPSYKLLANTECSLVQIYSGNSWGTAVLLSQEKGIFITNSHVIDVLDVNLHWKDKILNGKVIYKTSNDDIFDLAIVKCDLKGLKLVACKVSQDQSYKPGDVVYSAGYSLFSKHCRLAPTITRGHISEINRYILKTTCSVHPGASGGAILESQGCLLGIIVCNAKLGKSGAVYPRLNMAVPVTAVWDVIRDYLITEDKRVLSKLNTTNKEAITTWKILEGKL